MQQTHKNIIDKCNIQTYNSNRNTNESEVREMWTVLFIITTIVFAVRYWSRKIAFNALMYFIVDIGYTAPTKSDLEQCIDIVTKKMVEEWFKK